MTKAEQIKKLKLLLLKLEGVRALAEFCIEGKIINPKLDKLEQEIKQKIMELSL